MIELLMGASPLAVIALLAYIIYLLVRGKGNLRTLSAKQETIASNHLHGLPEMLELLRSSRDALERIEAAIHEGNRMTTAANLTTQSNLEYIKARINGGAR